MIPVAVIVLGVLAAAAALLYARPEAPRAGAAQSLVARADALLPQTQCRACGYPGCRPYAEAVVAGSAPIDRCPPGGGAAAHALAQLLGRDPPPGASAYPAVPERTVAVIDEDACIGCTRCIDACPVDAIVGAPRRMHTVVGRWCTGCALCIPPCPVDCISVLAVPPPRWRWPPPAGIAV